MEPMGHFYLYSVSSQVAAWRSDGTVWAHSLLAFALDGSYSISWNETTFLKLYSIQPALVCRNNSKETII